jgi:hypothetical protein
LAKKLIEFQQIVLDKKAYRISANFLAKSLSNFSKFFGPIAYRISANIWPKAYRTSANFLAKSSSNFSKFFGKKLIEFQQFFGQKAYRI